MKKIIATTAIVLLLAAIAIYTYVSRQQSPSNSAFAQAPPFAGPGGMQRSVPVETEPVKNSYIEKKIEVTGAISANAEVEVYPEQTGELVELLIEKGDKVKAGQKLASIESRMFQIQVEQAEAQLTGAKAGYEKTSSLALVNSETNFKQARSNLDRLKFVLEQAKIDLEMQKKQVDIQIKKAKADLRNAQARLNATVSGARKQDIEQAKVRKENAKRGLDRLTTLLEDEMVSKDQVESAQLQYDIYSAQLSLLMEGARPEDIDALEAQVEAAKASLESAENNKMLIETKQANLEAAKAQLKSAQALFEQANASQKAATWEKDLLQTEASLKSAKASLELAQERLEQTIIKSPIDGVIAQRFLDKGDSASPTRPFVSIVDMDVVKVIAKVPEREVNEVKLGQKAIIKPDALPTENFSGEVVNISPIIDRASQTCDVEIEVSNSDYRLKPGMFTSIELTVQRHEEVPVIPSDVILKEDGDKYVFVVDNGKAVKNFVVTGISDGVKTEIVSGLKAGEQLVVEGYHTLKDGIPINVVKPQSQEMQGIMKHGDENEGGPGK